MRTQRLALLPLAVCLVGESADAQEPPRTPPVRVQSTFIDPNGRWPDSLRQTMRDSLARGRERWQRTRPPQYLVATIVTWAMAVPVRDPAYDGQLEAVRVRGDSVVGIVRRPAPQYIPAPPWTHVTIDRVFRELEAAVASPARQVAGLTLDSIWGFPRSWTTDDARKGYGRGSVTEQASGGAVVFFEPIAERRCAGWRRRLHRCR